MPIHDDAARGRRRFGRVAAMGGLIVAAGLAAVPALGEPAPSPASRSAPCASTSTGSPGAQIAGYTLSALATGFRYQVNSPGLLPVGDATEGNVTEADVPFARTTVSQGPLVDATASPGYPGDTAAHLGTALATFGAPSTPNDPALAEASFPPSPGRSGDETFNSGPSSGGVAAGAGSAHATATASGGSATSSAASSSLTSAGAPALSSGASSSRTSVDVASTCVGATADTTSGAIDIGGVIKIAGVSGAASVRSDGRVGVPRATLTIGRVTVAGLDAVVDRNGIHLKPQQPVGAGVVDQVQSLLRRTLGAAKLTVHVVEPTTTVSGATASASSGGLAITGERQLPATGVAGLPALSLPGVPPIPIGTPPVPLHVEAIYGTARAAVAATSVPTANAGPAPPGTPTQQGGGGGVTPAGGSTSSSALDTPGGTSPTPSGGLTGAGSSPSAGSAVTVLSAGPIAARPRGGHVPMGWVVIGVALSIVATAPILGYARWQLIDGRT